MNLLLLRLDRYRLAVNTCRVARVQPFDDGMRRDPQCLMDAGSAPLAVMLANRRILPVTEIEATVEWPGPLQRPKAFARGCGRNPVLCGFVIVSGRVYGVLNDRFLNDEENP
jgi:hypothetical protein